MSKVVEALLENAYQDSVLLQGNDEKGDVFSIPRQVDFFFYAPTKEKGELVAGFINDNCYGNAIYYESEQSHCIRVEIHTPIEQNIITSISGLMTCIGEIYGVEYDGWGCPLQRGT